MIAPVDPPLDPVAAQALARVRRLMLISLLVTVAAIGVVLTIVGYRLYRSSDTGPPADVTAMLPKSARVIAAAATDTRIVVTIEIGGGAEIWTFDNKTLKPTGRLRLTPEP